MSVTGSILATYEPEDDDEAHRDVRIWFRARGDFPIQSTRGRYYHPNDPDGPGDDVDIELDQVDIINLRRSPTGEVPSQALLDWAKQELISRYWETREIAGENSGPDPDEYYDRKRDEGW
jgi:hypothetical protein